MVFFHPIHGDCAIYFYPGVIRPLPSRELTYPPKMAFWVDDFPNFPRWDMLILWRVTYIYLGFVKSRWIFFTDSIPCFMDSFGDLKKQSKQIQWLMSSRIQPKDQKGNSKSVTYCRCTKILLINVLPKNGHQRYWNTNLRWLSTTVIFFSKKKLSESWSFLRFGRPNCILSALDVWRKFENTKTTLLEP